MSRDFSRVGRWGGEDERGAANLVDAAATMRGLGAVSTGKVLSLSIPIKHGDSGPGAGFRAPPQHFMTRHGGDYAAGLEERPGYGYSDDVLMLATHGSTHIDALAHVWQEGIMYNGFAATDVTSRGAARCGIDKLGVVATRAIFVDCGNEPSLPHRAIRVEELQSRTAATGVIPEAGDALLVRTGWLEAWRKGSADKAKVTGLHHDCAGWIVDSGFALVAADNLAVEVLPSLVPDCALPLHIALTRDNGVYLAELLDLEALSTARRAVCMLIVAPLAIAGGVGSPITPVAIL